MPSRDDLAKRDSAERLLRGGRPREALELYRELLGSTHVHEPGLYEGWLEGALTSYRALGRTREAGYVLFGLRRFEEAQACFDPATAPLDWALAASRQGAHGPAARLLSDAGHPALAALELEAAGNLPGARAEWGKTLSHPRLKGLPYETALVHFNLGEVLLRLGEAEAGARELVTTQVMLEELADDFETRGERERAFDCYGILLHLGKDTRSFENVAEGYMNAIRLLAADDMKFYVLQYYDDFLSFAVERGEWHAAATLAREVADYAARKGMAWDRHYLVRAAELWSDTARHNEGAGGPTDLSENALHQGIDAATSLGDMPRVGRLYAELAALPLSAKKRERYLALARRYSAYRTDAAPPPSGFPDYLRRPGAYQDVWRQDMIEWEIGDQPAAVLSRLVVEKTEHARFSRLALRAVLQCADPGFDGQSAAALADLCRSLGRIQVYEVLRPLEVLHERAAPPVRAAVMDAVKQVFCKRSFVLVRKGLADPDHHVRDAAIDALGALRFHDALDPLARIFREFTDERVRHRALDTVRDIGSLEAAGFLLDVLRHEPEPLRTRAAEGLGRLAGEDVVPLVRQALEVEVGEVRAALEKVLRDLGRRN